MLVEQGKPEVRSYFLLRKSTLGNSVRNAMEWSPLSVKPFSILPLVLSYHVYFSHCWKPVLYNLMPVSVLLSLRLVFPEIEDYLQKRIPLFLRLSLLGWPRTSQAAIKVLILKTPTSPVLGLQAYVNVPSFSVTR